MRSLFTLSLSVCVCVCVLTRVAQINCRPGHCHEIPEILEIVLKCPEINSVLIFPKCPEILLLRND